jgi:hypothetical protein
MNTMTRILTDEFIKPPPSLRNTFSNMMPKIINMTTIIISFFRSIVFKIEGLPQTFPIKMTLSFRDLNHMQALPERDRYNNFIFTSS